MSSEWEDGSASAQKKYGSTASAEPNGNAPPSPTKRTENDGLPVFWAFVVLLAAALVITGFNWARRMPPAQIEIFSNIAMFAVAAKGFFALGQPSTLSNRRLSSTLGNLTVSALAFFMNIKVFERAVRWDHLLDDLWNWHIGWIICAAAQVLFLSGFAQYVLQLVLRFSEVADRQMKRAASAFVNAIKQSDKGVLLIFLTGAALWGTYLGSQISGRGVQAAFSDVKILWGSVLLLLIWTMVGILLYVAPAIYKKSKWTIFGMDGKRIVIAIGIAAAVVSVVLIFALLALLGGVRTVLTVLVALVVLAGLICAAVKYSIKKSFRLDAPRKEDRNGGAPDQDISDQSAPYQNDLGQSDPDQSDPRRNIPDSSILRQNSPNQSIPDQNNSNRISPTVCRKPNLKDVLITILAYIIIPLILVCVIAVLSDEVRQLLATEDHTWQQLLEVICGLLRYAGNGPQT